MLSVKEIFGPTLEGEGDNAGVPCIFIRFAGCNMWNGILKDRANSQCPYCDTDFAEGRRLDVKDIINEVNHIAKDNLEKYMVVLSGGEPFLQDHGLLEELCGALYHDGASDIQVETNGTKIVPEFLSKLLHIVCSPKVPLKDLSIDISQIDCLKILYPHPGIPLEEWLHLTSNHSIGSFYLQPIEALMPESFTRSGQRANDNIVETIVKVIELGDPWRLSIQQHKMLGLK